MWLQLGMVTWLSALVAAFLMLDHSSIDEVSTESELLGIHEAARVACWTDNSAFPACSGITFGHSKVCQRFCAGVL